MVYRIPYYTPYGTPYVFHMVQHLVHHVVNHLVFLEVHEIHRVHGAPWSSWTPWGAWNPWRPVCVRITYQSLPPTKWALGDRSTIIRALWRCWSNFICNSVTAWCRHLVTPCGLCSRDTLHTESCNMCTSNPCHLCIESSVYLS